MLRGAVGREGAEDCFQETFLAALRAYPSLRDDAQPARLADHDRPPQGDRPPPRPRPRGRCRSPRWREVAVEDPSPATTAIWARGRRAAAEAAGRGDPALRQRPPPRRDRRGARLLAGGGAPQPARGTETTAKGAGMKANRWRRLAERAAAEGLLDVAYTTTDSPFGTAAAGDGRRGGWSGSGCPTRTPRSCWSTSPSGSRRGCSRRPAELDEDAARARPLLRGQARPTSTCRSTGSLSDGFRLRVLRAIAASPTARPAATRRWPARPATSARSAPPAPPAARNPIPLVVPCHRVLRSGGGLGGYGGGGPDEEAAARRWRTKAGRPNV